MSKLKLFTVWYLDDNDSNTYLTTGMSEKEVQERESKVLDEVCACFTDIVVCEVNEVNGHKIVIEE